MSPAIREKTISMSYRNKCYRDLEDDSVEYGESYIEGLGMCRCGSPNKAELARLLQARGRAIRRQLADFEIWLVSEIGLEPTTARRKAKLAGGALADYPEAPWLKLEDCGGERCLGVRSPNYRREIALALERYAEWTIEDADDDDEERMVLAGKIIGHLGLDAAEIVDRVRLRLARDGR